MGLWIEQSSENRRLRQVANGSQLGSAGDSPMSLWIAEYLYGGIIGLQEVVSLHDGR